MLRGSVLRRLAPRRGLATDVAAARRAARDKARKRLAAAEQGSGGSATWAYLAGATGVIGGFSAFVAADTDVTGGAIAPLSDLRTWLRVNVMTAAKPLLEPTREELLPKWPMPGVPPGMPPPPTLVIDLEGTLARPDWSRKHGWRYAKRPGFDAFLKEMSKYYEIVLFSSQQMYTVVPFLEKEMAKGQISHVLFRTEMKWRRGHLVKPIEYINRPKNRIVCLDAHPTMLEENPEHALFIPPFDEEGGADDSLVRLIPFFVALVTEDVRDYPRLLAQLGTHDALEAADIYRSRVVGHVQAVEDRKRRGLGGLIYRAPLTPDLAAGEGDSPFSAKALAAADAAKVGAAAGGDPGVGGDVAGLAPMPAEKKGGFWSSLDRRRKDREEFAQRTMEKFNDVMVAKEREMAEKAAREQA